MHTGGLLRPVLLGEEEEEEEFSSLLPRFDEK
jgi:hypothetical protein